MGIDINDIAGALDGAGRSRCQMNVRLFVGSVINSVAKEFSYGELREATKNFSRKLGEVSFGEVYEGNLMDAHMPKVAVKKLKLMPTPTQSLEEMRKDYITEVMILGQLHHRNLVKLVGWCDGGGADRGAPLLVYEFMEKGSVDKRLHGMSDGGETLSWAQRHGIVLGVGSAIEYLHTGYRSSVVLHRDIKPSDVMLDGELEAKLGDFGLVREVDRRRGYLAGTRMRGSLDYIGPECCVAAGKATAASDMYSFGVLLLEVATGKDPAVLRQEKGAPYAPIHAVRESYGRGAVLEMADRRLNGDFDRPPMEQVLLVGLMCAQRDPGHRPDIRDGVIWLKNPDQSVPRIRV
ncbi:hypothetical protein ACP4OV_029759 [Aristida adscensionis]